MILGLNDTHAYEWNECIGDAERRSSGAPAGVAWNEMLAIMCLPANRRLQTLGPQLL